MDFKLYAILVMSGLLVGVPLGIYLGFKWDKGDTYNITKPKAKGGGKLRISSFINRKTSK